MIKFFRRIRQSLLSQNRFAKYLLYAIGEIVLVVIGILIALEINNQNELKKNKQTVKLAFKEIQDNLLEDIEASTVSIDNYLKNDSIYNKTLDFENPWTVDDFKNGTFERIGNAYYNFKVNTNGYENLQIHLDKLPIQYNPILRDLKILYVDRYEAIQVVNKRIQNSVFFQLDILFDENYNLDRLRYNTVSEEELDYYLNDDRYKRNAIKYMNDWINILDESQRYRVKAIETYLKIDSLLDNKENEIPYRQLGQFKDSSEVAHLLGNYEPVDASFPLTFKLYFENNYMHSINNYDEKIDIYRIDDDLYMYMAQNYPAIVKIATNKQGTMGVDFLNQPLPRFVKVN
ncbi:hypothetical protein [Sediminicola luteus]|uniref:Uncharacterized protein n=1 Tax=Sediminicola luteus TaxID=319238 RepID=A0ABV2TZF7_9FLAO